MSDALELLGLALAFIGGFALMVEYIEIRAKRRRTRKERFMARVVWPDTLYPPSTRSGSRQRSRI